MAFDFLYSLLSPAIIYLIGTGVGLFIKNPEGFFYRLFFRLTTGITAITIIYTLIATGEIGRAHV